jgi:hypothetical protein
MPVASTRRRRPLAVLASALLLIGAGALGYWAVFVRPSAVNLDAAQEQAVRTSITSYLELRHSHGVLSDGRPNQEVRWVCADQLIEVSRDQDNYKVGLRAMCQEFTAVQGELVVGSGESGPKLATVTSSPRAVEVLRVEQPPDGSGYGPWIRANFSRSGAAHIDRMAGSSRDLETETITKARNAFGLPADAPVRR